MYYETIIKIQKILEQQLNCIVNFSKLNLQGYYLDTFDDKMRSELFVKKKCTVFNGKYIANFKFLIFLSNEGTLKDMWTIRIKIQRDVNILNPFPSFSYTKVINSAYGKVG